MRRSLTRVAALVAVAALAACGGGSGSGSLPQAGSSNSTPVTPYTGPQSLANFTWGQALMKNATYVGPASFGTMTVHVQLQMQNEQGLLQYAKSVSDPHSASYRHFLTPQQIGQEFGASQTTVDAATKYFQQSGLGVGTWPQHLAMTVTGTQANLEKAFGTTFGVYREYGQTFIGPHQQPHFSTTVPVTGVFGLAHLSLNHTYFMRGSNGQFLGMSPQQLRRAFDFTGAAQAGYTGTGINVGIVGTAQISPNDVPAIGKQYNTPVATVTEPPVVAQTPSAQNGGTGTVSPFDPIPTGLATPPPVTAPCGGQQAGAYSVFPTASCDPEDGEAQLDTEQIAELASGSNVLFYLAFNNQDCTSGCPTTGAIGAQGLAIADDEIQQAIADNKADVLSLSYGLGESDGEGYYYNSTGTGYGPAEFAALAAEGIAVFVSSGDTGAYACTNPSTGAWLATRCVSYPASDPSVTAVGGVNYPLDGAGNLAPGAAITAWASNSTQGGDGSGDNSVGSGGGLSGVFATPSWQSKISILSTRGVPDVSMMGDPLTGPSIIQYANFAGTSEAQGASGGTSAAAPEMAAVWAVVLQACKASASCATATGGHPYRLGDAAPLLYSIYNNPSNYASTFFDVVSGSNGAVMGSSGPYFAGYNAGVGYDMVTGVGVPFVGHLIDQVVAGANVP